MLLNIFIILLAALFIPYTIIIYLYRHWFLKLKPFVIDKNYSAKTKFSIIIPARNEEENIASCVRSILLQNYPQHLIEVIVVDDHSTDLTSSIVKQLQSKYQTLQLIKLSDEINGKEINAYKKKAIEIAIEKSSGEWIVTTDADCIVQKNWLQNFDAYIQKNNSVFVGAPVIFKKKNSVVHMLQYIDFIGMQTITAATVSAGFHSMCNGANLAYKKSVFYEVNGFKDIDNIASGDDMLLMNKIKTKYPSSIGFVFSKESIVTTDPMPDWKSFINQRIRWASKATHYKDKNVFWVLVLVYLLNLIIALTAILSIFQIKFLLLLLSSLLIKTLIELLFMLPAEKFFGEKFIKWFPILQPLHIAYIVLSGFFGRFGKYQWKGRTVK